ncbi:MAG: urea ABC transporter permease subunit UrtB, partial [Pseudomonadota bacterium]
MSRFLALTCLLFSLLALPAHADRAVLDPIIAEFATAKGFKGVEAVIDKLAATGDADAGNALRALSDGKLRFRRDDGAVF